MRRSTFVEPGLGTLAKASRAPRLDHVGPFHLASLVELARGHAASTYRRAPAQESVGVRGGVARGSRHGFPSVGHEARSKESLVVLMHRIRRAENKRHHGARQQKSIEPRLVRRSPETIKCPGARGRAERVTPSGARSGAPECAFVMANVSAGTTSEGPRWCVPRRKTMHEETGAPKRLESTEMSSDRKRAASVTR